jgi:ornithine decarboxylase
MQDARSLCPPYSCRRPGIELQVLNVGGGFPARYNGSKEAELSDFFSAIRQAVKAAFGDRPPVLECEPGRALVAGSTSLLTRVKLVRHGPDEVFINDGIYGALMECWQVPELLPPFRAIRDGLLLGGPVRPFTVFGPTCDPLDRLPDRLELPSGLREGDFIEFGNIGAYGAATMTRFNGYGSHATVNVRRAFPS